MSTFSATVNAGAAYLVNDLYKPYVNPGASNRTLIRASYLASVLILAVGMAVGYFVSSINQATLWITSGLFGGYAAANVLKWYWWRLNGYGYFIGMIAGIALASITAIFQRSLAPTLSEGLGFHVSEDLVLLYCFPIIFLLSGGAAVFVSFVTTPLDEETLKAFYRNVRPWGFWKPVHAMVVRDDPSFQRRPSAARDLLNCAVGIVWQLMLVTIPIYVVLRDARGAVVSLLVLAATSFFLKKFWFDRMNREEAQSEHARTAVASAQLEPAS
jgi:hypothetical protein